MTDFTDEVVRLCNGELELFEAGRKKEYHKAVFKRVGTYWDELAKTPPYGSWKGYNGRKDVTFTLDSDGEVTRVIKNENEPWSAAFISWVAKTAGAGTHLSYSPSHSTYIVAALREAMKANSRAKFIARRHTQYAPKIGDLIACERRLSSDATFDDYIEHVNAKRGEAHCDFVVGFSANNRHAITVGGNVGDSVRAKRWPLNTRRHIGNSDPMTATSKVICIIECRL